MSGEYIRSLDHGCGITEGDRIILLIDVDCFEVQVYQRVVPEYRKWKEQGKPCIVTNSAGRIVAVDYIARPYRVSRDDYCYPRARKKCPPLKNIKTPDLPDNPGRPDYTIVRQATNEIVDEIRKICLEVEDEVTPIFEYSSRDEFYVDVTDLVKAIIVTQGKKFPSNIIDLWPKSIVETPNGPVPARQWTTYSLYEIELFYGLGIGSMILERVKENVGFQVSVGIGRNKLIAKIACGLNKPAAVTLILPYALMQVGSRIDLEKVPGLGGKTGQAIKKELHAKTMLDLRSYKMGTIAEIISGNSGKPIGPKKAQQIFNSVHGICKEKVIEKLAPNSIQTSAEYRRGTRHSFTQLMEELRSLINTILKRADEELKWRHRYPMKIKLTIRRFKLEAVSATLDYPIDNENADEIMDMFLDKMALDDIWDIDGEPLSKLELQAQPFNDVEVEVDS